MTDQDGMSEDETAEDRVGDEQSASESVAGDETGPGNGASEAETAPADGESTSEDGSEEVTSGKTAEVSGDADDEAEDDTGERDADAEATDEHVESDVDRKGDEAAEDLDVADEVLEYVESSDPEAIADELATLRFEVEALETERDDYKEEIESLRSRLKRKQADFENYKKRMKKRREQEKARATEDLVTRLLDVRDNLQRALGQDEDTDIRDGVETTLKQFDRVLDEENVEPIEPEPGDEVDPERHEVLVRMDSDQPAGTIAEIHRPGYEMAGKVIRTAQVAVSDGE